MIAGSHVSLISTATCPLCGHAAAEAGDCRVFCSHGSAPCPPVQVKRAGG